MSTHRPLRPCLVCGVRTTAATQICQPCRHCPKGEPSDADGLRGGHWVSEAGGVMRWKPWTAEECAGGRMTRDELLQQLAVERQDQTWWTSEKRARSKNRPAVDDEMTCARRRRELVEAWDEREREVG